MANQAYRTLEVMMNGLWSLKVSGKYNNDQIFTDLYADVRRELNRPGYSASKGRVAALRIRYKAYMESL